MRKAGNKEKKSRGDSLLFSGMNMRKKQRRLMEISLSGIENQVTSTLNKMFPRTQK